MEPFDYTLPQSEREAEAPHNSFPDSQIIDIDFANELYDAGNTPTQYSNVCKTISDFSVEQTININLPAKQTVLNYSAFACALVTSPEKGGFQLELTFNFTDGTSETQVARKFNPYSRSWQNCMGVVVPKNTSKTVNTVTASFKLKDSDDFAYVTGMQLCLDTSLKKYEYDDKGNFLSVTDSSDGTVKSVYDSENRLTEKKMRDGAKYSYTYKGNTNLLETTTGPVNSDNTINSELYQITKNTYNDYGQLTATEQYNGNNSNLKITSSSAYSTNGKYLLSSTNELGTVTQNQYDDYDNLSKVIYDDVNTENSVITSDNMFMHVVEYIKERKLI